LQNTRVSGIIRPMSEKVYITGCASYGEADVTAALERSFAQFGGIEAFVRRGARVLIKPNLLAAHVPSAAVTTHPAVVKALATMLRAAGAEIAVGDSPPVRSLASVAEKTGMKAALAVTGARLCGFTESKRVRGRQFKNLEIAAALDGFDVVINVAKLKTHEQMRLTLAVKNMFGCVVGKEKPAWHLRAGVNRHMFAKMLVDIYLAAKPSFNIVEGVLAMEGDGPGARGRPRELGLLAAGVDAFALDRALCRKLGVDERTFYQVQAAREMGVDRRDLADIEVVDDSGVTVEGFALPTDTGAEFALPPLVAKLLKRWLTARPAVDRAKCVVCGVCAGHCPVEAITEGTEAVVIDDRRCIRCYCCMELCPEAAIRVRRPLLVRVFSLMRKLWRKVRRAPS